jgi:hypothetical protein
MGNQNYLTNQLIEDQLNNFRLTPYNQLINYGLGFKRPIQGYWRYPDAKIKLESQGLIVLNDLESLKPTYESKYCKLCLYRIQRDKLKYKENFELNINKKFSKIMFKFYLMHSSERMVLKSNEKNYIKIFNLDTTFPVPIFDLMANNNNNNNNEMINRQPEKKEKERSDFRETWIWDNGTTK